MHHTTDRITHTTAFVTPVVEHWLEREIAQWVHPMKDRSDDPSHQLCLRPCSKRKHGCLRLVTNSPRRTWWSLRVRAAAARGIASWSAPPTRPAATAPGPSSSSCGCAAGSPVLHYGPEYKQHYSILIFMWLCSWFTHRALCAWIQTTVQYFNVDQYTSYSG